MAKLLKDMKLKHCCYDCGVSIGELHVEGCDVESCTECGMQKLSCECEAEDRETWTGIDHYNIRKLCEEHDLYTKWETGKGWVPAAKDDKDSHHDLNRGAKLLMKQRGG